MGKEEIQEVYQFHILLLKISPAIWRRVLVSSDQSLADFHHTLQIVIGWDDTHLHRFLIHGRAHGISREGGLWLGYGKDSFLRQPYAPLKSQKPFLHPISTITYEKSFI